MSSKIADEFVPATQHATLTPGEVIRMLRELKGWTQEQLAEQSGLHAKNISLLENGKVNLLCSTAVNSSLKHDLATVLSKGRRFFMIHFPTIGKKE